MSRKYHQEGLMPDYPCIWVFGSNLAGKNVANGAKIAADYFAATHGVVEGRTGSAYAIPTRDENLVSLRLIVINASIEKFILYANEHQEVEFFVTRIGCGVNGYGDDLYSSLFANAPDNCIFPISWKPYMEDRLHKIHQKNTFNREQESALTT